MSDEISNEAAEDAAPAAASEPTATPADAATAEAEAAAVEPVVEPVVEPAVQSVAPEDQAVAAAPHRIHNFLVFREGGEEGVDEVVGSLKEALSLFGKISFRSFKITGGTPTISCGDAVVAVLDNFVLGDWKIL